MRAEAAALRASSPHEREAASNPLLRERLLGVLRARRRRSPGGSLHDSQANLNPHPHQVKSESDSIGGTVACVCRKVPPALGEPVFDRLEAKLAHAMLSLPATKVS